MAKPIARPMSTSDQRVIRVFISSTFRDMQEEREELVKRVFPLLLSDNLSGCELVMGEVDAENPAARRIRQAIRD